MRVSFTILFVFLTGALFAQEKHWASPDHFTAQYAGSIGYFSGGFGYDVFKGRGRTSAHFGHVPRHVGGPLNILAAKIIFVPKAYHLSRKTTVNPFDMGLMVSYHLGDDFRSSWPKHRYPENYYWWQTSFRLHLNLESSITFKIRDDATFKAVTGYVEVNSNELYLISLIQNRHALGFSDVVKMGVGTRFHF